MNRHGASTLDACFQALSDPTRRAIVERLAGGEATVTELAEPFDMSLPAVSKHIGVLEDAGLVERGRRGRTRPCRLVAMPMIDAADWIRTTARFWQDRLDALEAHLAETREDEP